MRALYRLLDLLFPPKCVLCGRLLDREETDLCGACRREGPVFSGGGMSIPFVTAWMAVYAGAEELPKVLKGLGIAIISTSKGVMTDKKARELHVGGEVLAFVW